MNREFFSSDIAIHPITDDPRISDNHRSRKNICYPALDHQDGGMTGRYSGP